MIPEIQEAATCLVIAPVASGKTWLLNKWMDVMTRVVQFDTTFENERPDFEHFWATPKAYCDRLDRDQGAFKLCYHPTNIPTGFQWTFKKLWQLDYPRFLVVDEVHEIASLPETETLLRYGRKRLLGFIGATQRIADINKTFTANARSFVFFYTHEARDLDAIESRFGPELAEAVTNLRPLVYEDATGAVKQTPEAISYRRGFPFEKWDLGTGQISSSKPEPSTAEPETEKDEREEIEQ